jgi:predicted RNA-binding Zn ribbon-like protein
MLRRPMRDPRPLTGEPLALDLVNTRWNAGGSPQDLLADAGGVRVFLAAAGLTGAPADGPALQALREARDAIRAVAERRGDLPARQALNAVLAHGRVREALGPDGPDRTVEVDEERWRVPWLAARNLLELLAAPERLRTCAHPDCILHFYDTSRSGRRQWCSMAACGNRAKARRHYERARAG